MSPVRSLVETIRFNAAHPAAEWDWEAARENRLRWQDEMQPYVDKWTDAEHATFIAGGAAATKLMLKMADDIEAAS